MKAWVTKVGSETSSEAARIVGSLKASRENRSPLGSSEVTSVNINPESSKGNVSSELVVANSSFEVSMEVSMIGSPNVSSEVARKDVSSTLTPRVSSPVDRS